MTAAVSWAMPPDALGVVHSPVAIGAPLRIVSLVPSLTELLCVLGLARYLVGRTGFCIHPRVQVQSIEKVGGTKDVRSDRIRALAPTHLIVNIDENEKPTIDALAAAIPCLIVTHPQTPHDNLALYLLFGALFAAVPGVSEAAVRLCNRFTDAMQTLTAQQNVRTRRVLYCIWQDPWMTVTRRTYIGQMLALIGWEQWEQWELEERAHAQQQGSAEVSAAPCPRYPVFTWSAELTAQIDLILLSTEPYSFGDKHIALLERQTGKPGLLIDGELLSWYGSRAIAGLNYLGQLRTISGD